MRNITDRCDSKCISSNAQYRQLNLDFCSWIFSIVYNNDDDDDDDVGNN